MDKLIYEVVENGSPPKPVKGVGWDLIARTRQGSHNGVTYKLGVKVDIPKGYIGFLVPKLSIRNTSLIAKTSMLIVNDVADELSIAFHHDPIGGMYNIGDVVCQLILVPVAVDVSLEKEGQSKKKWRR